VFARACASALKIDIPHLGMGTRQHGHKLNESGLEHCQIVKILRNGDSLEAQLCILQILPTMKKAEYSTYKTIKQYMSYDMFDYHLAFMIW
jgi:hypothetical protein